MTPRELGQRLRAVLTPRALAAWAGTDRVSALPLALDRVPRAASTPAARLFALVVAGDEAEADPANAVIEALREAQLVECAGRRSRARVAILPLGQSLLVCDRLDAQEDLDLVCWPDDSSYHLARALPPGRRAAWLDLGCGSAFAPLPA